MLKKIMLIIGLMACPILANATLTTNNNTDFDSTVKVTSNPRQWCAAKIPPFYKYTPKHGQSTASLLEVRALCGALSGTCSAEIYLNLDCTGQPIASASIDIATQNIVSVQVLNAEYKVSTSGSTITFDKVGAKK